MNSIHDIEVSDMQHTDSLPYKIIQSLLSHIADVAEIDDTVNEEYEFVRDLLDDSAIEYEEKNSYIGKHTI